MIKDLYKTPKLWLTLDVCERAYKTFRELWKVPHDPIPEFETRYPNRLESILGTVEAVFDDVRINPTVLDAAASYFNYFARGQAFLNGNKRMAVLFTHLFLLVHGVDYNLTYKEMYNLAAAVAKSGDRGIKIDITKKFVKEVLEKFTQKTVVNYGKDK